MTPRRKTTSRALEKKVAERRDHVTLITRKTVEDSNQAMEAGGNIVMLEGRVATPTQRNI